MISYIITSKQVTYVNPKTFTPVTYPSTHKFYQKLVDLLQKDGGKNIDEELLMRYSSPAAYINSAIKGTPLSIEEGNVYFNKSKLPDVFSKKILSMLENGDDISYLIRFIENLNSNPSYSSVNELYLFLEKHGLTITQRGTFLCYKKVRNDYKDIYSGTMDNSVGSIVSVERNQVDDNREKTCSYGLHVCSYEYLSHFGSNYTEKDRVLVVEVNPKDVVSVPKDYDNAKMRVSRYYVLNDVTDEYIKGYAGLLTDDKVYTVEEGVEEEDWSDDDDDDE